MPGTMAKFEALNDDDDVLAFHASIAMSAERKKMKKKKDKSLNGFDAAESPSSSEKKKKKKHIDTSDLSLDSEEEMKKKKKKKKQSDAEDEDSNRKKKRSKRKSEEFLAVDRPLKASKVEQQSESEERSEIDNPNSITNFRISQAVKEKLKAKGIVALFPIQALSFDAILDGNDLVGRACTGQGKTLAFVLPIMESLSLNESFKSTNRRYGRAPSVLVLVPTRELAKQVHADFEYYCSAMGLSTVCIYGGAPYGPQQNAIRRGVDVVVGTPGRIKDHLERGSLNLKTLKFRVLDEADEMLNMGFVDDVEMILGYVEDLSTVQTLLFSATMPDWVKKIASRFLKDSKETVDLVGEEKIKTSSSVRHLLLPCMRSARSQLIPDVVTCYSSGGRTIIFTETKHEASELAGLLPNMSSALHGDIAQAQREVTLAGFRSGKFTVLVATDVAARGLDINDVQLVIQCEPPRDVETYIHRSGRTGRAGKTGVSVVLNDFSKEYMIPNIERKAGFKFERISAPHPAEIAKSSCTSAIEKVVDVSDSVLPIFRSGADQLIRDSDLSPTDLLAKALARIAGYTDLKRRSLLSSRTDFVTLMLQCGKPFYSPSYAFGCLKRCLPEDTVQKVKGMSITADGLGAVFDVPSDLLKTFVTAKASGTCDVLHFMELESLPELQARAERNSFGRGGSFSGSRGNRSQNGFFRSGISGNRGQHTRWTSFGKGGYSKGDK